MRQLVKTIQGQDCEIFAIRHHDRISVGKATPEVEIIENSVEVPMIGNGSTRYKKTIFSIVICPDPEMDAGMTEDMLHGLTAFDLSMLLPRRDGVFVPFRIYSVSEADISQERWEFTVNDPETVKKLLAL